MQSQAKIIHVASEPSYDEPGWLAHIIIQTPKGAKIEARQFRSEYEALDFIKYAKKQIHRRE